MISMKIPQFAVLIICVIITILSSITSFKFPAMKSRISTRRFKIPSLSANAIQSHRALNVSILYEDEYFIAMAKPSGIASMPCESAGNSTAVHLLLAQLSSKNRSAANMISEHDLLTHGVVHRLDKDVSGLLLLAKHKNVSKLLSVLFLKRKVQKTYIAVVHGSFLTAKDTEVVLNYPLLRRSSGKAAVAISTEDKKIAKPALTRVKLLGCNSSYSILAVRIDTGRFHQIRVHLAHAGYPIAGDKEYKSRAPINYSSSIKLSRTMLHSYEMKLVHPITKANIDLLCPLPSDMESIASGIISFAASHLKSHDLENNKNISRKSFIEASCFLSADIPRYLKL